jgi:uncharacterized protein YjiK
MTRSTQRTSSSIDWVYVGALAFIVVSTALTIYLVGPPQPPPPAPPPPPEPQVSIPFDLHRPDRSYSLPSVLKEISAVVVSRSEPIAWAVNDEQALVFRIDLNDGSVEAGQTFAKPGDYEGIELVEGALVVARSDGTLWRIADDGVQKVGSPLSERYNVEGLAWDVRNSRLLVACKGKAGRGAKYEHTRAVYAVRIPTYEWMDTPAFVVERAALRRFLEEHEHVRRKPGAAKSFAPSAIGVDPVTGSIYILSSGGRMLVVLDAAAENILEVVTLSRDVHAQPEGLAFDGEGALYISNEGRGTRATLHRFDRRNDHDAPSDEGN